MDLLQLLLLLPLLWKGTISQNTEYGIRVQETVTVQEGLCVSIPCSFYYPQRNKNNKAVYGYWYYTGFWKSSLAATNDPQESVHTWARGRFHLIGDPQMNSCSLLITAAQKNDYGSYTFWVKNEKMNHGYKDKVVSIHVNDLTQKPVVHIPEILKSGHQVNLTCRVPGACSEGPSITFLWTGTALSPYRFASQDPHSSQLLFTPQPQHHGTSLTCRVTFKNPSMTTETTVQLRVPYPPGNMKIISSANGTALMQKPEVHIPEILESGHPVTLTCLVPGACREGNHFTYLWTGTALSSQGSALLNTSKLLFTPQSQDHGTNITCQVTFPKARVSTERTVQLQVTYPPQNMTISVSWANKTGPELLGNTSSLQVLEGESLTLVCATESNPPATLIWTYRNQVLQSSEASDPGVLYLELSKLGPKDRGEYTCQAQHPLGPQQHSVRLCVQTCSCCPISEENGSWPLIFTLLRGAVMGASFLLTYGLTWLYYTCRVKQPLDTMDKSELMDIYSVPVHYGTQDMSQTQDCWIKSQ
ncbi:sialic acid-binding Ig-like lectin 14 isoform X3 [Trichosurus vulpecula]|uniref:sialic acid-binding Ig-like lectin 14 isoform X3 n=1 Tax=Trichosurus vulpecula TaxID=9337 RepID=UPI00186B1CB8|nr:sialic acid-binding Ig-like lectin 14 isoform X3 [Trichosurus vulpecula]